MVRSEMLYPFSVKRWKSCVAVVSSSSRIRSSTIFLTSGVILEGRPLPGSLRWLNNNFTAFYSFVPLQLNHNGMAEMQGQEQCAPFRVGVCEYFARLMVLYHLSVHAQYHHTPSL